MKDFLSFPKDLSNIRILVSNDDGIHAHGLKVLEKIARELSKDVWVVCPETEQSGVSHSLTLHHPLRVREISKKRFAVNGTPTDCVLLAVKTIIPRKKPAQLVLSGVNIGANVAEDVTYSGTIAATMEGTLLEIPSIAFSLSNTIGKPAHWKTVEVHAPALVRQLLKTKWQKNTLLNVNFPNVAPEKVKGVKVVALGQRQINEKVSKRTDPFGRNYYWVGAPRTDDFDREDIDLAWLHKGYITVTPLCLDLTHHAMVKEMQHFNHL